MATMYDYVIKFRGPKTKLDKIMYTIDNAGNFLSKYNIDADCSYLGILAFVLLKTEWEGLINTIIRDPYRAFIDGYYRTSTNELRVTMHGADNNREFIKRIAECLGVKATVTSDGGY